MHVEQKLGIFMKMAPPRRNFFLHFRGTIEHWHSLDLV